jgi:hypothetical protein
LSLFHQQNSYEAYQTNRVRSTSFIFNSFQNIQIGQRNVYLNISCSRADNKSRLLYFNSSLFSEAGYSYNLFKKITSTSGVIYDKITGYYDKIGFRQAFSGYWKERFNFTMYVDFTKDRNSADLYRDPVRGNLSVYYIIKKQR